MNFIDFITTDLAACGILKCLKWNELLLFRQVCRTTKRITDLYIEVNTDLIPEIEINLKNRSLVDFLGIGIPVSKIFLNNMGDPHFYDKIGKTKLRNFVNGYGSGIKSLRVGELSLFPVKNERRLMNGLANVQSFEAGRLVIGEDNDKPDGIDVLDELLDVPSSNHSVFPKFFGELTKISIGFDRGNIEVNTLQLGYEILNHCPKLQEACYPYTWLDPSTLEDLSGTLTAEFLNLQTYLENREARDSEQDKLKMKIFDFKTFDTNGWEEYRSMDDTIAPGVASKRTFLRLCDTAIGTNTYFKNVPSDWFLARNSGTGADGIRLDKSELGRPILSLVGMHPCVMTLEMPNLEKITIPATSRSLGIKEGEQVPEWPKLKSLDITVNGNVGHGWDSRGITDLDPDVLDESRSIWGLYQLFFGHVVRVNMTELELSFLNVRWGKDGPLVPKCEHIVSSCPNLRKVKLGNWKGTNKALVTLWTGLTKLEEVDLQNCDNLGNVAFVGEDLQDPVFLKLKNLRKVSLKGLDKMPKVTDLLFCKILSKMELKELVLTAEKPLEKITKDGITALLEGPFGKHVEKFSFQGWALANVSYDKLKKMERQFRCNQLIGKL